MVSDDEVQVVVEQKTKTDVDRRTGESLDLLRGALLHTPTAGMCVVAFSTDLSC